MFKLSRLALALLPALLAGSMPLAAAGQTMPPLHLFINDQPSAAALSGEGLTPSSYRLTTRLAKGSYRIQIADRAKQCGSTFGPAQETALPFGKANPLGNCAAGQHYQLRVLLDGDYDFTLDNANADAPTLTVLRATHTASVKRALPEAQCHRWGGGAVTASVGKAWPDGTVLRDAYSGQQAQVRAGKITLTPAPGSEGILLLEPVSKPPRASFNWDNATVYFMLTDRFNNGDTRNDHSFGRRGDGMNEIGT